MARIRTDNVFGTVTDNPLLVGATSLNSNGLANLAAVAAPDIAVITLDPNRVNGAPEIIHVTAHTASSTTATILRGQEGTAAREHPQGAFWTHAPTVTDWGTDWKSWTPTFTNFTVGNGVVLARFARSGNTIDWRLSVSIGSTSIMGDVRFSLPVAVKSDYQSNSVDIVGVGSLVDATGPTSTAKARLLDTVTARVVFLSTSAQDAAMSATVPFIWAAGDDFTLFGTYEAA